MFNTTDDGGGAPPFRNGNGIIMMDGWKSSGSSLMRMRCMYLKIICESNNVQVSAMIVQQG